MEYISNKILLLIVYLIFINALKDRAANPSSSVQLGIDSYFTRWRFIHFG